MFLIGSYSTRKDFLFRHQVEGPLRLSAKDRNPFLFLRRHQQKMCATLLADSLLLRSLRCVSVLVESVVDVPHHGNDSADHGYFLRRSVVPVGVLGGCETARFEAEHYGHTKVQHLKGFGEGAARVRSVESLRLPPRTP